MSAEGYDLVREAETAREAFDRAYRATCAEIRRGIESDILAVWTFGYLRGVGDRELRHAALDGVMTALDDVEYAAVLPTRQWVSS